MCPRDIIKGPRIPIPEDAWENVQREQGDRDVGDDPDEEEEGNEAGSEEGYEGFESQAECEHAKEVEHPEDKEAGVAESWGGGLVPWLRERMGYILSVEREVERHAEERVEQLFDA